MPGHSSFKNVGVEKLVERQMRNWELARSQRATPPPAERPEVEPFVAVSRAVGSVGPADDDRIRQQLFASMDERDLGWFEESLRALMHGEFTKNDYFPRLTQTVLAIARQGSTVFVGRAADLILPRHRGLCVRLTVSGEHCVRNYAEQHKINPDQARAEVQRIETERAEFVQRHFKVDAADQNRHDLIVNLEQFTPDQAVELILTALKMRGIVKE